MLVQESGQAVPTYRVVDSFGPEHKREFVVEVLVDGAVVGRGRGKSKQKAEKDAAQAALEILQRG